MIQDKTTKDRIAAAKARIAKASGAVPLPGQKKEEGTSTKDATPAISRRASADAGINVAAQEDSQVESTNASVDETAESSVTLANGDATEGSEAVEGESTVAE